MKRILWAIFFYMVLCAAPAARADEPFFGTPNAAAVLQNPSGALSTVKTTADAVSPAVEELFDLVHGDHFLGSSMALWTFSAKQVPIAKLRAGMATEGIKPYAELQLDLPAITNSVILPVLPQSVKDALTAGVLDSVWSIAGRFAHGAAFVGWDNEHDDLNDDARGVMAGFSVGMHW